MRYSKHHIFRHPASCGMILVAVMTAFPCTGYTASPPPCTMATVTPRQPTGVPGRLRLLEDRNAIEELKAAYAYAIDSVLKDPSKIDSLLVLFHDDICLDYGPFGTFRGKEDIKHLFQVTVPTISTWNFHVASHPILVINGARGTGIWKVAAAAVLTSDTTSVQQVYATYQDEYVKTATGWKFKVIKVLFDTPPASP
jgi:hypothetical protein